MNNHTQISVIIPCYNEAEILEDNFRILANELDKTGLSYEVIFCNDGSTDATLETLRKIQGMNKGMKIISYTPNRGAGYAYQRLYDACRGEMVFQMDADLSMKPDNTIPMFLKSLENADVVVGSRYKGIAPSYPLRRRIASKVYSTMNKFLFGLKIMDTQSGFIAFRRHVLNETKIESDGFEALLELFIKLSMRDDYRIKEVPIKFTHETLTGETDIFLEGSKMFRNTLKLWSRFIIKKLRGEIWR